MTSADRSVSTPDTPRSATNLPSAGRPVTSIPATVPDRTEGESAEPYTDNREPALKDVLRDPIVRLLMDCDGERLEDVLAQLLAMRKRILTRDPLCIPDSGLLGDIDWKALLA